MAGAATAPIRVGFIGAGKMAAALANGLVKQGQVVQKAGDLMASCPVQDNHLLDSFKNFGCETTNDNRELVEFSDVIILAVKPMIIPKVLQDIQVTNDVSKLVMSIAAGVKINLIEKYLNEEAKVIIFFPIFIFVIVNLLALPFSRKFFLTTRLTISSINIDYFHSWWSSFCKKDYINVLINGLEIKKIFISIKLSSTELERDIFKESTKCLVLEIGKCVVIEKSIKLIIIGYYNKHFGIITTYL